MSVLLDEVEKRYGEGAAAVAALRGVSLVIEQGELVVVVGPSGSGKTTLLNVIGALERPTAGSIVVAGSELAGLDDAGRTATTAPRSLGVRSR